MNWFSMRRRMMGKGLSVGSLAVGREVIIPVDGVNYNWIVVHQGENPCKSSLSGTWLMMKNIYRNAVCLDGTSELIEDYLHSYRYNDPAISDYLNGDFYEMLDDKVKPYLRTCTFESTVGSDKGLVFRCSERNLGFDGSSSMGGEPDTPNNAFDYFKEYSAEKFIAKYDGEAQPWWTNGVAGASGVIAYVTAEGKRSSFSGNRGAAGIRPMLLCDPDFKILRDMIV